MDQEEKSAIEYEIRNRCLIIKLSKELDHHNAVTLREQADYLIDKGNVKHIIFDFSKAGFMDSSGIGVIMGRYKKVIFTGGKVAVIGVGKPINRIFQLSGLYKIIEKYDSLNEVLQVWQQV